MQHFFHSPLGRICHAKPMRRVSRLGDVASRTPRTRSEDLVVRSMPRPPLLAVGHDLFEREVVTRRVWPCAVDGCGRPLRLTKTRPTDFPLMPRRRFYLCPGGHRVVTSEVA